MASADPEPPKHKTWVFRVSIHCEGCKRKVQKLIQSLPGVHDIQIETKRQRVVVTGDVSPESLIRKLVKSGKHAELWPENPPEIHTRKIEEPPSNSLKSVGEESAATGKETKPPANKKGTPPEDPSKSSNFGGGVTAGKVDEGEGKREGGKVAVEVKVDEKKPAGSQDSRSEVDKKEQQTEVKNGVDGGEEKKKKKKKPGNINKTGVGETSSDAPKTVIGGPEKDGGGGGGGGGPPPTTVRPNQSPPRHRGHQYPPPHYYTPPTQPAPVYTVSHNTAYPAVNSYTTSYYAAAAPQSYAYSHFTPPPPLPPSVSSEYESYLQQPVDSFEMFSDENPNGCLIM